MADVRGHAHDLMLVGGVQGVEGDLGQSVDGSTLAIDHSAAVEVEIVRLVDVLSEPHRDPRKLVVSVVYLCTVVGGEKVDIPADGKVLVTDAVGMKLLRNPKGWKRLDTPGKERMQSKPAVPSWAAAAAKNVPEEDEEKPKRRGRRRASSAEE